MTPASVFAHAFVNLERIKMKMAKLLAKTVKMERIVLRVDHFVARAQLEHTQVI
jgi:hypothetical protein